MAKHSTDEHERNTIPAELQALPQWVNWRLSKAKSGRLTKKPVHNTVDGFVSWDRLPSRELAKDHGIGLAFTGALSDDEGNRIVALDLDACLTPTDELTRWAKLILDRCPETYIERSPGGAGLHVWLRVENPPEKGTVRTVRPGAAAVGSGKAAELQVFGLDVAQYMALTGDRFEDAPLELALVPDIEWLLDEFTMRQPTGEALQNLPTGDPADLPVLADIERELRSTERGRNMLDAKWWEIVDPVNNSASEAHWAVVQEVLRLCKGHGHLAADFLEYRTEWGKGNVHESRDPDRYGRRDWIEREIMRAGGKTTAAHTAEDWERIFGDLRATPPTEHSADDLELLDIDESDDEEARGKGDGWAWESYEIARKAPEPGYLVKGMLRRGQVGFLCAFPTVGKTNLAVSLGCSVRYGRPWCNRRTDPGSVLYLVGEDRSGFLRRLRAFEQHHGLADADAQGRYAAVAQLRKPLSKPKDAAKALVELVASLKAHYGHTPSLIVIDTLAAHWLGSEDSSELVSPAMAMLGAAAEILNCAIVLVHHTTKTGSPSTMPNLADLRGSSAFLGAADFVFGLSAAPKRSHVFLQVQKAKNDPQGYRLRISQFTIELGTDQDGDPQTAPVLDTEALELEQVTGGANDGAVSDGVMEILNALRELGGHCRTKRSLGQTAGIRHEDAVGFIDIAMSHGWVEGARGSYTLTQEGSKMLRSTRDARNGDADAFEDYGVDEE